MNRFKRSVLGGVVLLCLVPGAGGADSVVASEAAVTDGASGTGRRIEKVLYHRYGEFRGYEYREATHACIPFGNNLSFFTDAQLGVSIDASCYRGKVNGRTCDPWRERCDLFVGAVVGYPQSLFEDESSVTVSFKRGVRYRTPRHCAAEASAIRSMSEHPVYLEPRCEADDRGRERILRLKLVVHPESR